MDLNLHYCVHDVGFCKDNIYEGENAHNISLSSQLQKE